MNYLFDFVEKFLKEFFILTSEMGIYLISGFFVAGLIHVFLPDSLVEKHVGKRGFFSSVKSALFGVPLPLCSCGVVPAALSLKRSGASKGSVVSFLVSTPQTGMDSIAATYSLLGGFFAFFRVVVAFISGVAGGVLTDLVDREEKEKEDIDGVNENAPDCHCVSEGYCCNEGSESKKTGLWGNIKQAFNYGFGELLDSIAKWIVVGLVLGAFIDVILPENFFSLYLPNRMALYFVLLLVSIPVYVCATGSIPIASSLILKGVSPGAAFVFLMAGPATNSVTFTVLLKSIGKKATIFYLLSIVFGAILGGITIDLFFSNLIVKQVLILNSQSSFSFMKVSGGVLLLLLLIFSFVKGFLFKRSLKDEQIEDCEIINKEDTFVFKVEGMTCHHCVETVSSILDGIEGIESFSISPEDGTVLIKGNFDFDSLRNAIEHAGYSVLL